MAMIAVRLAAAAALITAMSLMPMGLSAETRVKRDSVSAPTRTPPTGRDARGPKTPPPQKKAMKAKSGGTKTHTLPGGIICSEAGTKSGVQGTLDCRPAPTKK